MNHTFVCLKCRLVRETDHQLHLPLHNCLKHDTCVHEWELLVKDEKFLKFAQQSEKLMNESGTELTKLRKKFLNDEPEFIAKETHTISLACHPRPNWYSVRILGVAYNDLVEVTLDNKFVNPVTGERTPDGETSDRYVAHLIFDNEHGLKLITANAERINVKINNHVFKTSDLLSDSYPRKYKLVDVFNDLIKKFKIDSHQRLLSDPLFFTDDDADRENSGIHVPKVCPECGDGFNFSSSACSLCTKALNEARDKDDQNS